MLNIVAMWGKNHTKDTDSPSGGGMPLCPIMLCGGRAWGGLMY